MGFSTNATRIASYFDFTLCGSITITAKFTVFSLSLTIIAYLSVITPAILAFITTIAGTSRAWNFTLAATIRTFSVYVINAMLARYFAARRSSCTCYNPSLTLTLGAIYNG